MKLVNNMDLIGRVEGESTDSILFSKLRALVYQQSGGTVAIGFGHFMPAAEDGSLSLRKSDMMICIEAPEKIATGYRQATSGIQVVNNLAQAVGRNGSKIIEQ